MEHSVVALERILSAATPDTGAVQHGVESCADTTFISCVSLVALDVRVKAGMHHPHVRLPVRADIG
jgi:hypothetical protein